MGHVSGNMSDKDVVQKKKESEWERKKWECEEDGSEMKNKELEEEKEKNKQTREWEKGEGCFQGDIAKRDTLSFKSFQSR